jgi:hypothetical protein
VYEDRSCFSGEGRHQTVREREAVLGFEAATGHEDRVAHSIEPANWQLTEQEQTTVGFIRAAFLQRYVVGL